jgi:hypothetical protein
MADKKRGDNGMWGKSGKVIEMQKVNMTNKYELLFILNGY